MSDMNADERRRAEDRILADLGGYKPRVNGWVLFGLIMVIVTLILVSSGH